MKDNRMMALSILAATLTMASPSYAQSCSASAQNQAGDTISVTATLFTSDPNENGEGAPLSFSSSGGEVSGNISAYNLPTPFSYVATAANESFTGIIHSQSCINIFARCEKDRQ